MDSLPIVIPAGPATPPKASLPIIAALVPFAAGLVLWLVTGSLLSLCFAAVGPLMLLAAVVDGRRSRRAARRRAASEEEQAWARAEEELSDRHEAERTHRRHRDPDAATALSDPPLREGRTPDATTSVVVGSGSLQSAVRTAGGGDGERSRQFRIRATRIDHVPITTTVGRGVALRGAPVLTEAAARALALQLCLRFAPSQLVLIGEPLARLALGALPHALQSQGDARTPRGEVFRLGVADHGDAPISEADATLWLLPPSQAVPDGITCVVDIHEVSRASLRTSAGVVDLMPEFVSRAQVTAAGASLDGDARHTPPTIPDRVLLGDLPQHASASSLVATLGRGAGEDAVLDLVDDGPHALVTGTTGSGKSELLVSWVTALATAYGPDRVVFVLADFKGGTAFEQLRALPHVVAVVTDLDPSAARRGVASLTAELRRREAVLAQARARDIAEIGMARLVIVVDEFAALLQEHPDLALVFTDIAARGRALGMHLVLGTQRAVGVVRDALAANCPLRVSLRVGDAADSRAVIGSDAAAEIGGGPESRGLALVRRPSDAQARPLRVAMTRGDDVARAIDRWASIGAPRSPWLPPLPAVLALSALEATPPGTIVLGRADDPDRQEQPLELVRVGQDRGIAVIGQSGSGRTSALRALAAQWPGAVQIPADPEHAWDLVHGLGAGATPSDGPALILCDDLDAHLDALPPEHAGHLAQLWERIVRTRSDATIVLTAVRASGAAGRILDLLPRRALLRMSGRTEHLAAGGDVEGFLRDRPSGRARLGEREVQIAWVPEQRLRSGRAGRSTSSWVPQAQTTAIVSAGADQAILDLGEAYPDCVVGSPGDPRTVDAGERTLLVADAETWQREWALWLRVRAEGEVLVRAENPVELRQLTGFREVPPYARPHAGRAWALRGAGSPRRVVVDVWRA